MKRIPTILGIALLAVVVVAAISLIPRFRNMKAEYRTIEAIDDIQDYLRQNKGKWPSGPELMGNKYPIGSEVVIDYSMTSERLLQNRKLARDAVHPQSNRFYTRPGYPAKLDELIAVIKETNTEQAVPPNGP